MDTAVHQQNELTPACTLGFIDRLTWLLNLVGLHKSGFIAFLIDATGMSASGVRRIITDKRPPKRLAAFNSLSSSLAAMASRKAGCSISTNDIASYLLEGRPIDALSPADNFDISLCFKNDENSESEKVATLIRNLVDLASQNLL